jgi:O-antigen/teichoic acid export membrane protein
MDVLMLTALCAAPDVGTYRVALALALLCQIPVMALVTALNPMLAALIERGERARLEGLVRAATRWLLLLVAPVALALLLVPDLALAPFDPAYVAGIPSLRLLLPGVVVLAISAPTLRLIPMGGHARLNLLDHLGAAGLNAGLNLWLIPRLGPRGAALATSVSFGLWALVALLQARHLLGCLAWDRRNLAVAGALLTFGVGALAVGVEAPAAARLALLCACCAGLAALVWRLGLAEEDLHVLRLLRARLGVDRA